MIIHMMRIKSLARYTNLTKLCNEFEQNTFKIKNKQRHYLKKINMLFKECFNSVRRCVYIFAKSILLHKSNLFFKIFVKKLSAMFYVLCDIYSHLIF